MSGGAALMSSKKGTAGGDVPLEQAPRKVAAPSVATRERRRARKDICIGGIRTLARSGVTREGAETSTRPPAWDDTVRPHGGAERCVGRDHSRRRRGGLHGVRGVAPGASARGCTRREGGSRASCEGVSRCTGGALHPGRHTAVRQARALREAGDLPCVRPLFERLRKA